MQFTTREAFLYALSAPKAGNNDKAAAVYRQLLDNQATRDWLQQKDMLQVLYSNLVIALHEAGRPDDSLSTFQESIAATADLADPDFDRLYVEALRRTGMNPMPFKRRLRFHKLIQLFANTAAVSGSVAECGCYRGLSSSLLCHEQRRGNPSFSGRGYLVFDSFRGLSQPTAEDSVPDADEGAGDLRVMTKPGHFAAGIEVIRGALASFPEVEYHPGWIPESFAGLPEKTYRFVHVDVDLFAPTIAAFAYFYPRLAPGERIVSDDYAWPGAQKAVEGYCREQGLRCEVSEFKQAIVTKPVG